MDYMGEEKAASITQMGKLIVGRVANPSIFLNHGDIENIELRVFVVSLFSEVYSLVCGLHL